MLEGGGTNIQVDETRVQPPLGCVDLGFRRLLQRTDPRAATAARSTQHEAALLLAIEVFAVIGTRWCRCGRG